MGPTAADLLVSLAPMVLLLAAWAVVLIMVRRPARVDELMRRQTEALERIANALERRADP